MPAAKIGHGNSLWIPRIRNLYRAADWKKRGRRSPACCGTASRAVWPGVEASVFAVGQLWLRSGDRACAGCCPGLSLGFGAQKTTDMNRCRMLVQCGNVGAAFRIGCERAFGMRVNAGCRGECGLQIGPFNRLSAPGDGAFMRNEDLFGYRLPVPTERCWPCAFSAERDGASRIWKTGAQCAAEEACRGLSESVEPYRP